MQVLFSCKNADDNITITASTADAINTTEKKDEVYHPDAGELLKDFRNWYNYTWYNIRLSQEYMAQDQHSKPIHNNSFLQQLASGNFIALKTAKQNDVPVYTLVKQENLPADIQRTMVQMAETALVLEGMKGKPLPSFRFTDMEGNNYTPENTKGRVLLVKCWFINCVACVKEFPELNELVAQYKDRKDISFISLASDSKKSLAAFLEKKPFQYAVVPQMDHYMTEQLRVNAYPLHLLVNKEGKVVKATNSMQDMLPWFEKEIN
ncbi:MAG: TlpA family protein disulfide reductase [Flavisolibacter sp.]